MRVGATVRHDGVWITHPLESIPHSRGDNHERIVVRSQEDLHQLTPCQRVLPIVVEHQLDASEDARVVQCHLPMLMPTLDHAFVDG